MSDFLDGLERDLVKAMHRHEARHRWLGLSLPRPNWRALVAVGATAAACVAAITAVSRIDVTDGELSLTPSERAPAVVAEGDYRTEEGDRRLLVEGARYTVLRCRGNDCGPDTGGELGGPPKVPTGTLAVRGDVVVFSDDPTCRIRGVALQGTYRAERGADGVRFTRLSDQCRSRSALLEDGAWSASP